MTSRATVSAAAIALLSLSGLATAQPGTPKYVSGLLHTPLGGATFGPVTDRRLPVQNIGSSGQDGVEINLRTSGDLGASVEVDPILASPGAECKVRYKGWDGLIRGSLRMSGSGGGAGGACDVQCDYGSYSSPYTVMAVRVVLRDSAGAVMGETEVAGGIASCTVAMPLAGGGGTVPPPTTFSLRGTDGWDLKQNTKIQFSRPATVTGVLSGPTPGVGSVEFIRILCITAPCPGDGTNILSMQITGANIPGGELVVDRASYGDLTEMSGAVPSNGLAPIYGTGSAHLEDEVCDALPPAQCSDTERRLPVRNLGSSGEDGVNIDLRAAVSIRADGVIHRDLAARNVLVECAISPPGSGGGGGGGGGGGAEMRVLGKSHELTGNVTLVKLTRYPDPLDPSETVYIDGSGRGSLQCQLRFLDDAGAELGTATVGPTDPVVMQTCSGRAPRITTNSDGTVVIKTCTTPFFCIPPTGVLVPNVSSMECRPVSPTTAAGVIEEVQIRAVLPCDLDLTDLSYEPPEHFGGRPLGATGAATLAPQADGSLLVSNIGSSGQDGVEVQLDAMGGGGTIDLTPLLQPGAVAAGGEIKIKHKGWDGLIHGTLRLAAAPGGAVTETCDLTGTGVAGMTWRLYRADGTLARQGHVNGAVFSWTITPQASGETCEKQYLIAPAPPPPAGSSAALRDAHEGFFDVAMTVSGLPPGEPVIGNVTAMSLTPDPCAGLPENCPPHWTNLTSVAISASNIPAFRISDGCLSVQFPDSSSIAQRVIGLGGAVVDEFRESPTLTPIRGRVRVTNIGSSGQDGVSIDLGSPRVGTRVALHATHAAAGSGGGGGGGSGGCAASFRHTKSGHVTLMKLYDDEEPALGSRSIGVDSSGRGSTFTMVEFRGAGGIVLGSAPLSASDRVHVHVVPVNDPPTLACGSSGDVSISYIGPCDASLDSGAAYAGVYSLRFAPINPVGPAPQCDTIDLTGTSLDELVVDALTVTPPCPADVNGDGAITPADVASFVSTWFASLQQGTLAGDFDGNGVVNPSDVGSFVSTWFATLSAGHC